MKPIMDAVSSFVDAVIKVATMQIITGYDDNGKPIFEQIDVDVFNEAATVVCDQFLVFVKNLGDGFRNMSDFTIHAIESLDDNMKPIMDSVSSFVDAILKLATGQYIDFYLPDKDGNFTVPHFKKLTRSDYENAAIVIAEQFAFFIGKLTENFKAPWFSAGTEDALEAISENIKPIMDSVSTYVDAILKLATGTYIDHMEKDAEGKWVPIYKHVTP
jgi:hypothetical protein